MLDPKKFDVAHRDFYKLDRIRKIAAELQHPELGRRSILVAGTNGKGSVVAYLSAWLVEMGYRVGSYSSPHVVKENERIRIQNEMISDADFQELQARYQKVLEPLTYFERMTMLAFLYFREQKADVDVIEVGIGARLDATNICAPEIGIISSVHYDHQDVLGESLTEIATEKSGVMREGKDCFVPKNLPLEALSAIRSQARETKSWLHEISTDGFESLEDAHQQQNAALAYAALKSFAKEKALPLTKAVKIAKNIRWPARLQLWQSSPPILIDGGHNAEAIAALKQHLEAHFYGQKFQLIFGLMQEKKLELFESVRPWAKQIYFPRFFMERQHPPERLQQAFGGEIVLDLEALSLLLKRLIAENQPILVCGSFYLAGEVLRILQELKERP